MHDETASGGGVSYGSVIGPNDPRVSDAEAELLRRLQLGSEDARRAPERPEEPAGPARRAPSAGLVTAGFDDGERHPEQLESSPESVDSLGSGGADASQVDANSLVQSILQESYSDARDELESHAEKVRLINEQKAAIRESLVDIDRQAVERTTASRTEPQSEQVRFDENIAKSPEVQGTVEGMDPGELVGAIPINLPDPPAPEVMAPGEVVEAIPITLPDPPAPEVMAPGEVVEAIPITLPDPPAPEMAVVVRLRRFRSICRIRRLPR